MGITGRGHGKVPVSNEPAVRRPLEGTEAENKSSTAVRVRRETLGVIRCTSTRMV